MATELERTLGDALRRYADRIEKGEPYVRNSTIQKWCRDIANDMREDAAAYDTAQSQPGDTPEARSGDSGAVAWRYYPPKDPTCYIVKRHRITNMTECGLDGCVEEPLYTHPSDSAWRKAFAAWTDEILPRGISNRIDPETATDWIERRARELDAARDRGEARTAEGVGGGAITGECVNCGCELPTGCGGQFADEDSCPGYKIVSKSTAPAGMVTVPDGAALIAAERKRQSKRGFSAADDDGYGSNELARAAAAYLVHFIGYGDAAREWWPWESRSFKEVADPIRDLERAGALIAAEIDRIQRLAAAPQPESPK